MEKFKKHIPHYFPLAGILAAGIFAFYFFSYDRFFQIGVVVALAMAYVSWGVIHHTIHKDISLGVVLEYLAVAVLGVIMLLSLIFRS